MKAAVITKPYDVEVQKVPDPNSPKDNEVIIKIILTGICGSEIHAFKGTHPWRVPPVISGHELVGIVVEVGKNVESISKGMRVTVEPQVGCGECDYCKRGLYNLCIHKRILGTPSWPGSFAEYVVVPESCVIPVPNEISDEVACLAEPLAVGMHAARRLEIDKDNNVLVLGAGPIGLSICLAAISMKANNIVVTDISDYNLLIAKKIGVHFTLNSNKDDVEEVVKELTHGYGMDCVAIAVGNEFVLNQGLKLAKRAGQVVEVALFDKSPTVNVSIVQTREITIKGCNMYTREDFESVFIALQSGLIDPSLLVTHKMPIEQIKSGFEMIDRKLDNAIKILLYF